jgi:hypothetical protein
VLSSQLSTSSKPSICSLVRVRMALVNVSLKNRPWSKVWSRLLLSTVTLISLARSLSAFCFATSMWPGWSLRAMPMPM